MSGITNPFDGHIDEFRIAHIQRSDGWIATTWNTTRVHSLSQGPKNRKAASRRRWQALVLSSA